MAETKADSMKAAKKESNSRVQLEQTTTSKIQAVKKRSAQNYDVWYRGLLKSTAAEALKLEINAANQRYDSEIESFKEARNAQLEILAKSLQSEEITQIEYNKRVSEVSKNTSKEIARIQEEQRNSNLSKELAVEQELINTKINGINALTRSIKENTDLSLQEQQSRAETAKQWADEVVESKKAQIERLQNIRAEQEARKNSSVLSESEKAAAEALYNQVDNQLKNAEAAFQSALKISDEAEKSLEIIADKKSEILAENIQRLSDMGDESARNLAIEYAETLEEERNKVLSQIEEKRVQVRMTLEGEAFEKAMKELDEEAAAQNKKIDSKLSEINHLLPSQDENDVDEYLKSFVEAEEKERREEQKRRAILGNEDARNKAIEKELKEAWNKMVDAVADAVDENVSTFYQDQAKINALLQGADTNYQKALAKISFNVSLSPVISQKGVIEKLKQLVDSGVAYNLELRSYLATATEKIASTFNALDGTLLRLIRLQQADTTAARLGLESSLTRLFNSYFSDTSYLHDLADTVSNRIIEANSQLTRDMSIAFEYTVQKWLGSLYSVGFSQEGISLIADALNSLGSGNVSALSSNESAMNLVAISASRIGLSIGEILVKGLDASTTNDLLSSMIEYLQEIASNSKENQVAKNALAAVYGLSMSDIRSATNLTSKDLKSLYTEDTIKSHQTAINEVEKQLNTMLLREHASTLISTLVDNLYTTAATGIGGNPLSYALWKLTGLLYDSTKGDGINIPAIMAAGFGIDLNADVLQLIRAGMVGLPVVTSIINQLGSALYELDGGSKFAKWGFTEFTPRGSALKGITGGATSGQSSSISMGIGSNSASDLEDSTLTDAVDRAEEKDKIINQHSDLRENQLNDALFTEDTDVITQLIEINEKLDSLQAITAAVESMAVAEPEAGESVETPPSNTTNDPITGNKPSQGGTTSAPTGPSGSTGGTAYQPSTPNSSSNVSGSSSQSSSSPTGPIKIDGWSTIDKILEEIVGISGNESVADIDTMNLILDQLSVISDKMPEFNGDVFDQILNHVIGISNKLPDTPEYTKEELLDELMSLIPVDTENIYDDKLDLLIGKLSDVSDYITDGFSRTYPDFEDEILLDNVTNARNQEYMKVLAQETSSIKHLESTLASYDVETISRLMAETSVAASYLRERSINKDHDRTGSSKTSMNVSINEMSPEVTAFLAATIKTMVSSAILGEESVDDTSASVVQAIKNALSTTNLNVKVTNDNFDTTLQKFAFMN